jgi:integrase
MRGDGFVFERGARYWVGFYAGGKLVRKPAMLPDSGGVLRPAKNEREALRFLKAQIADVRGGRFLGAEAKRLTVSDLLDAVELRAVTKELRSARKVKSHAKALRAAFALVHAVDVTSADLERYTAERRSAGRADATINRELEVLRRAYRLAVKAKRLPSDRVPEVEFLHVDNARVGFFEPAEVTALMAQLDDVDLRDFVEWAFLTGMRKGEAAALTWGMVKHSSDPWVLNVPGSITKNAKPRSIGVAGQARAVLVRRWERRRLDCPLIFHRTSKGQPGQPIKGFDKAWHNALEAAKLPPGRLFHDLRRSAVRSLIRAGVDQQTAMRVSGHKTPSMFARYRIIEAEETAAALSKVDAWLSTQPKERNVASLARTLTKRSQSRRRKAV